MIDPQGDHGALELPDHDPRSMMRAGAGRAADRCPKPGDQLAGGDRELHDEIVLVRRERELEQVRRGGDHRAKRRMVIERMLAHSGSCFTARANAARE